MVKIVAMLKAQQRTRGTYTARIKIPADLRVVYAEKFGLQWSIKKTWPKTLTQAEADAACEKWVREVTAGFDALRAATAGRLQTLDYREVYGLVGQWYREFVGKYENNPGDPEGWQRDLENFDDCLRFDPNDEERDLDSLLSDASVLAVIRDDVALATKADRWLLDHGYAQTPESRAAFLDALASRYVDALALIIRRARGDFSHDPIRDTFPTLPANGGQKTAAAVSILALWELWIAQKKPASGTIRRWQTVVDAAHARWPDLRKATEADATVWLNSLVTAGRSAATVNQAWRTSLKTLCQWAMEQKHISHNPFAKVKVTVPEKIETRETKAFEDAEAATILRAALAVQVRTPLDAAKRWLPWLCAYSGARAGEVAQLRGQDIMERDSVWAMRFTPEAGTIKNRKPRTVPLHSHLIEQGFLDFVKSRGRGPLFLDAPNVVKGNRLAHPPSADVVTKLGEWVRSLGINDPELSPNHAWRHSFKLNAERAGIPDRISDTITGHTLKSVARKYGQPTLADLAREMAKFPRYKV